MRVRGGRTQHCLNPTRLWGALRPAPFYADVAPKTPTLPTVAAEALYAREYRCEVANYALWRDATITIIIVGVVLVALPLLGNQVPVRMP